MQRLIIAVIAAIVLTTGTAIGQAQDTEAKPINYEELFLSTSEINVRLQEQLLNCQSNLGQYTLPQRMQAIKKRQDELRLKAKEAKEIVEEESN